MKVVDNKTQQIRLRGIILRKLTSDYSLSFISSDDKIGNVLEQLSKIANFYMILQREGTHGTKDTITGSN